MIRAMNNTQGQPFVIKTKGRRTFGGKLLLSDFADKQERAFEKKHLQAYIKGMLWFTYGFTTDNKTGDRKPAIWEVKVNYI